MKVNRSNYEVFFLDYHEGGLDDVSKKEVLLFLESNPDLKAEFESFEIIVVTPPVQSFSEKNSLKKAVITPGNYRDYFVAYAESDLNPSERREVELFVETNPLLKQELEIFRQLKVTPDPKVVFKNKSSLKRHAKVIRLHTGYYRYAAAAILVLLLVSYFYFSNDKAPVMADKSLVKPGLSQQPVQDIAAGKKQEASQEIQAGSSEKGMVPAEKQKNKVPGKDRRHNLQQALPMTVPSGNLQEDPLLSQEAEKHIPSFTHPGASVPDSSALAVTVSKPVEHAAYKPSHADLSEVFSSDDLKELGIDDKAGQAKKKSLWDIASKGAAELGKITGTEIAMTRSRDELENTKTVAFAVGNFSVSHTSAR